MAALRILALLLLSGGLVTQPVLLQAASCCCSQPSQAAAAEAASPSVPQTGGCPNCRAAQRQTVPQQQAESLASVTTLRDCSCQKQEAPSAVARVQNQQTDKLNLSVAAGFQPSAIAAGPELRLQNRPQGHHPDSAIPARVWHCVWRI